MLWNPYRVRTVVVRHPQGGAAMPLTLGCDVERLRRIRVLLGGGRVGSAADGPAITGPDLPVGPEPASRSQISTGCWTKCWSSRFTSRRMALSVTFRPVTPVLPTSGKKRKSGSCGCGGFSRIVGSPAKSAVIGLDPSDSFFRSPSRTDLSLPSRRRRRTSFPSSPPNPAAPPTNGRY